VLRLLFAFLKEELAIQSESSKYGDMLRALAGLKLTGSCTGAVYQEQMEYALLSGQSIYVTEALPPEDTKEKKKKGPSDEWHFGATVTKWGDSGAWRIKYAKNKTLGQGVYVGPILSDANLAALKQKPPSLLFVAESQTFPSIDLSLAELDHDQKAAVIYHASISIDKKHFSSQLKSKNNHLPLDMDANPLMLLRSKRSKDEVAAYKSALLAHKDLEEFTIEHRYAVFDDNARDLLKPTPPFKKPFWVLSTSGSPDSSKMQKT
jgi:hypothetical protein